MIDVNKSADEIAASVLSALDDDGIDIPDEHYKDAKRLIEDVLIAALDDFEGQVRKDEQKEADEEFARNLNEEVANRCERMLPPVCSTNRIREAILASDRREAKQDDLRVIVDFAREVVREGMGVHV